MAKPKYRIDDAAEFEGHWWLPENSERKTASRLTFEPNDRMRLNLIGSLTTPANQHSLASLFFSEFGSYPVIHGLSTRNEHIVLLNSYTTTASQTNEIVAINKILVGSSDKVIEFGAVKSVSLELKNLKTWTECRPLSGDPRPIANREDGPIVTYAHSGTSAIEGSLINLGAQIRVRHWVGFNRQIHEINAHYEALLEIEFDEAIDFDKALEIASSTEQLMSLLMGTPAYPVSQRMVFANGTEGALLAEKWARCNSREISVASMMPCSLPTISSKFVSVCDSWLTMNRELSMVVSLLFSCLYKANSFLEVDFADCAHAIDAFAEISHNKEYLPDQEFAKLHSSMMDLIPKGKEYPGFRDRAEKYLTYLNRPSMRTRLTRLIRNLDEDVRIKCLDIKDVEQFVNYVADIRNMLAHPGSGDVWARTTNDQFREELGRLKLLLIISMLATVGVPIEVLRDRYDDWRVWQWG